MSRHRSIAVSAVWLACACGSEHEVADQGAEASTLTASGAASEDTTGGDAPADDSDGEETSAASGASSSEGDGSGEPTTGDSGDPPSNDSDSDEPHGGGMCGGGFGPSNDLAHLPPCPSSPATFHERYNVSRGTYYHDGDHPFEPQFVAWDDTLAQAAEEYADALAAGMAPIGEEFWVPYQLDKYDPYWDGTWQGYRAIAGMETPTSCDCPPPEPYFGPLPAPVFYNLSSAYFRANVVRIDGMSRMGIGHAAPGDGSHVWTLLFAE